MSSQLALSTFSAAAEQIEATSSNTQKTELLAELFATAGADVGIAARFVQGEIFATWDDRNVSVGSSIMYDALAAASGESADEIADRVASVGDPGQVCEDLSLASETGQQTLVLSESLTLSRVYETFEDIAETEGAGSQQAKVESIKQLLYDCSSQDAKFITRLLLGKMRIGVGSGTVRDAIASAFDVPVESVERGLMVSNDVEIVAKTARDDGRQGVDALEISIGRPIKPMLAQKGTIEQSLVDASSEGEVAVEVKYDGARLQMHVDGSEVRLFTRRMNEVTSSMPDVCDIVREDITAETAILDAEVVAYESADADEPLPFQEVMKRLRRKYDIEEKSEEIVLDIHSFDVLYADGNGLIDKSLRERRTVLESLCSETLADRWYVSDGDEVRAIETSALESGNEGVMVKNPASTYQPDNRGKNWLKIKPQPETLDCVVVGGEWGEGRRASFIGSYMLAVRDENDELQTIGKVATGISDSQLADLTERCKPLITAESGKDIEFEPELVFEVGYEELQPSPQYSSGFGLRFPRFITVREDKAVEDADTVERVERLYDS